MMMSRNPAGINLFKYIGKSYDTYNCFDLVKDFYADNFGLDIKNYFEGGEVPGRKEVESLIISNKGDFVKITDRPIFGDIVVIKLYGLECHIGVCIDGNRFLHSIKNSGSVIDRLERYHRMIAGFYRHRNHA